jgi:hypothetical protein
MDAQNEVEACSLPRTWEVEYSDMLMANEDDRLGQEVDLPFGTQNGLRIWTGTRTRPAAMAVQHSVTRTGHTAIAQTTPFTSAKSRVTSCDMCQSVSDACNRCRSEACAVEVARAQQIRTDRDVPAVEEEDLMMCGMSAGALVAATTRGRSRLKRSQSGEPRRSRDVALRAGRRSCQPASQAKRGTQNPASHHEWGSFLTTHGPLQG